MFPDPSVVQQNHHNGSEEEQETQDKSGCRRAACAGIGSVESLIFNMQQAGQQCDQIQRDQGIRRNPYFVCKRRIAEIGHIGQDLRGEQHGGQIKNDVKHIVRPVRRFAQVIHGIHSKTIHDDVDHGKCHDQVEQPAVFPHAE